MWWSFSYFFLAYHHALPSPARQQVTVYNMSLCPPRAAATQLLRGHTNKWLSCCTHAHTLPLPAQHTHTTGKWGRLSNAGAGEQTGRHATPGQAASGQAGSRHCTRGATLPSASRGWGRHWHYWHCGATASRVVMTTIELLGEGLGASAGGEGGD